MNKTVGAAIGAAIICLCLSAPSPALAQVDQDRKDLRKAEVNLALDPATSAKLLQGIISRYMKEAEVAETDPLEVMARKFGRLSAEKREVLADTLYWDSQLGGSAEDAFFDVDLAVRIAPKPQAKLFFRRGEYLAAEKKMDEAIADLTKALDLSASDDRWTGEILVKRGQAYLAQGRKDDALADFDRAVGLAKNDVQTLLALYESRAGVWEAKGDLDNAIQDITAAAEKSLTLSSAILRQDNSSLDKYLLKRGGLYRKQKSYERALADYNEVLKWNKADAALAGTKPAGGKGKEKLSKEEEDSLWAGFFQSMKDGESGRSAVDNRIDALFGRAAVFYDTDRFKDAVADYDEVLKLKPDDPEAYCERGNCLRLLGDRDGALASLNKALELAPAKISYYGNRADVYFFNGEYEKASADYKRFLEAYPRSWIGHQRRGICLHSLNDHQGAIVEYGRAIELNPRSVMSYNNLAWIKATSPDVRLRDGAKAVEYGKKALELAGQAQPWLYMDTLATAYAEAGDFRQAVDLLTKALALMTKPEDQKDRPDLEARLKLFQAGKPFREKPVPDRCP